jgi:glutamate racemase
VLAPALRDVLGPAVAIVDSAATTAAALAAALRQQDLLQAAGGHGSVKLLATDGAERFARVGAGFLGRPLQAADVEIVDLAFASASGA